MDFDEFDIENEVDDDDGFYGSYGTDNSNYDTNDNDDGSLSGFSDFNTEEPNGDNQPDKKRILVIACIGILVLLLVFFIVGIVNGAKKHSISTDTVNETVDNTNNQVNGIQQESLANNSTNYVSDSPDIQSQWTEITPDKNIQFGNDIKGLFTVTSIKYFAKKSGNETITNSVATGTISGLTGTYRLEIPYYLAINVNIGDSFELYYKLATIDGNTIVCISKVR